jgi:membrane protein DedA with SNARE-associated domain/membrane-associated phospholipid phosphatase
MHTITSLLAVITQHAGLAYGAVFLVALLESLALIGLVVPGTMILFGVGAIVATGSLDLKHVLLLASAGAIAGDGISFWLGHHYQQRLNRMWPFSRYPGILANAATFFSRHGGKSVLFGRFAGPTRAVIPLAAGMLGMRPLHFVVVNVFSSIGWSLAYILPGVFFGTSLVMAGAVSMRLAVLIFLILAACWSFMWFIRKLVLLIRNQGPIWVIALKAWAVKDTSIRGTWRPIKRFLAYLFQTHHGEEFFLATLILMLLGAGWGFLGVLQDVLARDPLVLADQSVYHFFQALRTPWADHLFVTVTEFGDSFVNLCVAGAIFLLLLAKRCYRTAAFWAIAVLGGLEGVQLLKWATHLPRPTALYHGISAYGFPSSHTTMSVVIYGFLAILLARGSSGALRWGLFVLVFLFSFFIAISRLYLGAHWLSDVLGGFFIGTSWVALLGIIYIKKPAESVPRPLLGLIAALAVLTAGGWHVDQRQPIDLEVYASRPNIQSMSLETWLSAGWRELPTWRVDMAGEPEQPLTLQWVGPLDGLARYLFAQGWQRPPSSDLRTFMGMLSPDTAIAQLPVLPRLHNGRFDRLRLVHLDGKERWVLRLWASDVRVGRKNMPLFIGTLEIQHRRHLTWLITAAGDTGEYEGPLVTFAGMLQDQFAVRTVIRKSLIVQPDRDHGRLNWMGRVVLLWEKRGADEIRQ